MKVLVTGARDWTNYGVIEEVLSADFLKTADHLIVGDCRGADYFATVFARENDWTVDVFEADWDTHGLKAGPLRNILMVKQKPDIVLAFHDDLPNSKGTKHCVITAVKADIPVYVTNSKGMYYELLTVDDLRNRGLIK